MSNRSGPTVTTVTKVKDGRHTYQFDLCGDRLAIEYRYGKQQPTHIELRPFAFKELGKLLLGFPVMTTLPPDEPIDRPPGSVPKEGIQGKETAEGMLRTPDGVESGMEE